MFRRLFRLTVLVALVILALFLLIPDIIMHVSTPQPNPTSTPSLSGLAQFIPANFNDQNNHLHISVSGLTPNGKYKITLDNNSCGNLPIVDVGLAVADSSGNIDVTFAIEKINTSQKWFVDLHQGDSVAGTTLACSQLVLNKSDLAQQSTPNSKIIDSKITDLEIRTTYPAEMEIHKAYPIELSLKPKSGVRSISSLQAIYSLILASNPTTNVASPTPVGTPNTTIHNAFGKGFEPFATATFYAGTFAVQPSVPEEQSLDQSEVTWIWNVTPQETGIQVLSGEIRIDWKSINQASAVTLSFIVGNPQIVVRVNGSVDWSPWIASGLTVVSGATLALLSWLGTQVWSKISKRRKNIKENEAMKTPNEPAPKNTGTGSPTSPS